MLEYLSSISTTVASRLSTMMLNLRSGSNSFFDSYRELVQDFVYAVFDIEGVEYSKKTDLSRLLASTELHAILVDVAGTYQKDIDKIRDYILKINKHVHKKEKAVNFEDVHNYILALYDFTAPYAKSKSIDANPPTMNDIHSVYVEYERQMTYQAAVMQTLEHTGLGVNTAKQAEPEKLTIRSSTVVFETTFSTYNRMRWAYIIAFIVFLAYNVFFIVMHAPDYNVAYILIPYHIFTLVHFVNFLKLGYDSDADSLDKYSMYKADVTHDKMAYISGVKWRHWIMLGYMIFFSLVILLGYEGNVAPIVAARSWTCVPLMVMGIIIHIYGLFYYGRYQGLHAVMENQWGETSHVYLMNGKRYEAKDFAKYFYNM